MKNALPLRTIRGIQPVSGLQQSVNNHTDKHKATEAFAITAALTCWQEHSEPIFSHHAVPVRVAPVKPLVYNGARLAQVLAVNHYHHDNAMSIVVDGHVICMLELERLFEVRYMVASELSLLAGGQSAWPIAFRALFSASHQLGADTAMLDSQLCFDSLISVIHRA